MIKPIQTILFFTLLLCLSEASSQKKEKKQKLDKDLLTQLENRISLVNQLVPKLDMPSEDPRWELRTWTNVIISRKKDGILYEKEARQYLVATKKQVQQLAVEKENQP